MARRPCLGYSLENELLSTCLAPSRYCRCPAIAGGTITFSGATARKVRPRASVPAPVKASNAIIALPLNPVVPTAQRLCSARTPTGLGYTMLRPGSGAKPTRGDVSLVNYIGYLATTGAEFDQGMRSPLPINGVIPGFSQGLQMLAKSGVARFCIHRNLRTLAPAPHTAA
jgi:hypothetical protein